jgi:hypothetical protein
MALETNPNEIGQDLTDPAGDAVKPKEDIGKQVDVAAEFAKLAEENKELRRLAQGAVKESEASKAYVAQLTATLQGAAERVANRPDPNAPPAPSLQERLSEDPLSVLDEHFRARTAPLVGAAMENNARLNRELFITRSDKTLWNKYGDEVDKFMGDFPSETRAQAGSYDAALRWVRAQHLDEEIAEREAARKESEKRSFVEAATAAAGGRKEKPTLTELQKTIAKGLGISEEDYSSYMD